jgi:protein gp37
MNDTGIAWTERTWNPVSGCDQVSSGCAFEAELESSR